MKRNVFAVGILSMALVIGLGLTGCEEEPEIECGLLTITNLPSVAPENSWGVMSYWTGGVYYDEEIVTQSQIHNWTGDENCVAIYQKPYPDSSSSHLSPFSLTDYKDTMKGFLKNGTYLVVIMPVKSSEINDNYAFMSGVVFKNGKATIDYNDMTKRKDIPYN